MKEFALLFRLPSFDYSSLSADEMKAMSKKWADWGDSIAAEGRIVDHGIRLDTSGKVLKTGGLVTDGPFVEIREMLGGLVVIRANDYDEALTIAHGCPVLDRGGSVEVRAVFLINK